MYQPRKGLSTKQNVGKGEMAKWRKGRWLGKKLFYRSFIPVSLATPDNHHIPLHFQIF